jgi:dihydropteroate synthase
VVAEVRSYLEQRIGACVTAGIARPRIVADPGFGFGKRIVDNLELLKQLADLDALGVPLLVGLSRKSMLARLTGRPVEQRTAGSVALAAIAVLNGARIVRAHDVAATRDAIRVAAAVSQGEEFDVS